MIVVSIVIPVYNVEKYLENCLESIVNQSYSKLEIILVNDGSTDESGEICNSYQNSYQNINVLHQDNHGVSHARNAGINLATGDYILFVDPDDSIMPNYIEECVTLGNTYSLDILISGYTKSPTFETVIPNFQLHNVMKGKELILSNSQVHSNNDLCFSWRYFYKLELIKEKNLRFNESLFIGEDVVFNLECLLNSERVIAIDKSFYYYTTNNPESVMRTRFKPGLEENLNMQYKVRKSLSTQYNLLDNRKYRKDLAYYCIRNLYTLILNNLRASDYDIGREDVKRILKLDMLTNSLKEIGLLYKSQSIKEYFYFLALKFKLYPIVLYVLKRN